MTQEESHQYNLENKLVEQTRPIWKHEDYFTEKGKNLPVTFLICQKNTKVMVQLAIESLLRFYPDVNILVVDDDSNDDSLTYLQFKQLTTPNLTLWEKKGEYIGHGGNMNAAIREYVKTTYVMLMDSDVIIERGGFVEEMLKEFDNNPKLYATGTLQISSYANNGGEPNDIADITPYANPQLSMYFVPGYLKLNANFLNDGTPCILNMKAAKDAGMEVKYFPTDFYCTHNSGSSWTNPRTTWIDDHDIKLRPFITFVISDDVNINLSQDDTDFDIVVSASLIQTEVIFTDGSQAKKVNNHLYGIRFNVHGEYVVELNQNQLLTLPTDFVSSFKKKVIDWKVPDEVVYNGVRCVRRRMWQKQDCLK